jgi:class 3 adenylate cyclase
MDAPTIRCIRAPEDVSRVVADLSSGKRLQVRRHPDAALRGFEEPMRIWELRLE